jgi:hypothetical protein
MDHTPGDGRPPAPAGKLTCRACGRVADCSPTGLLWHMRTGLWPRCCGAVMSYFVPAGKPWEPKPTGAATAVRLGPCPNCGRQRAGVFPLAPGGRPDAPARLVCRDCCPGPPTGS